MRILLTNNTLAWRAGSELYIRDLALGLLRRGHCPVVFSSILGPIAEELRQATVPVIDDLDALNAPPDLIHGQHHLDAMVAILRYPNVPAIYMCHGWSPWQERPPVFPSIRRYIAVDDLCRERLLTTPGLAADRIDVVLNGVDLGRFRPRPALPGRATSALIFNNYAWPTGYAETVARACKAQGIERVDICGVRSGSSTTTPEALLAGYDVVFAKARCALEAMAVGCAVVVADEAGLAGMVSSDNMRAWRRLNFGVRTMQANASNDASISAALEQYDAADAALVSRFIRGDASQEDVVDRLISIYQAVLAEPPPLTSHKAEAEAASRYVTTLAEMLKGREHADERAGIAENSAANSMAAMKRSSEACEARHEELVMRAAALEGENHLLRSSLDDALAQRAEIEFRSADEFAVAAAAAADSQSLRIALDSANSSVATLREIERSRAWRLIGMYRRVRRWLT